MTNSVYWIWFQLVFGIGTRRAELFMQYFEHPREILEGVRSGGRARGMMEAGELSAAEPSLELAEQIFRRTAAKGCEVLTPDQPGYPKLLLTVYSKPAALYVRGDLGCLDGALAIAMVGARKHSEYGKAAAMFFAEELAKQGVVIVSGLAPGIDTDSHLAVLAAGGKTVGILGCGIDVDYPRESREIKTAVSRNGAVVTEYPLGTNPLQLNFPMRNRVISGMSHGVLVVEADVRSGSLITARLAREQGRDVFAVPGSIFVRGEQGTHQLIKDGARLADHVDDILGQYSDILRRRTKRGAPVHLEEKHAPIADDDPENLADLDTVEARKGKPRTSRGKAGKRGGAEKSEGEGVREALTEGVAEPLTERGGAALPEGVSELAARVYGAFGADRMTVDELAASTALTTGELLAGLTELEIFGVIACHPGRRFGLL